MSSRALRRHHLNRIKIKVAKRIKFRYRSLGDQLPSEKDFKVKVGIQANCRTLCSCWMCGNPRKYFKDKSFQERKFMEIYPDMIELIDYFY